MKALTIFLLFFPFVAQAQVFDTITYFNEYMEKVESKDSAIFYREGNYDHGMYDGKVKSYNLSTGKLVMSGEYYKLSKDGVFKWYLPNGKKFAMGNYSSDRLTMVNGWDSLGNKIVTKGTGYFKGYHPYTGKVYSEGQLEKGKEVGTWIYYNLQGVKIMEVYYMEIGYLVKNSWEEKTLVHQVVNGNGEEIEHYKNGKREGLWEWYYPDHMLSRSIQYVNGLVNGFDREYYTHGKLCNETHSLEGILQGPCHLVLLQWKCVVERPACKWS